MLAEPLTPNRVQVQPLDGESHASQPRKPMWLFREMRKDLARRAPHYSSDWTDGLSAKVLSASLFMFCTSIAPAITFAGDMVQNTNENGVAQIGPPEVLLSTALTGIIFSIFAGQPLCVVGVTGPVAVFTRACFMICTALKIQFLPFYGWVQIWSAVMHLTLAATNACSAISLVSRFACETFGMLIALIYIYTGIRNLVGYFNDVEREAALLSLLLGLGTAWLALVLSGSRKWSFFNPSVRAAIADYAATVAVLAFCMLPDIVILAGGNVDQSSFFRLGTNTTHGLGLVVLDVPSTFGPTATGRSWLVDLFVCPVAYILFASIPGFFLTVLFFFDHNVSSLLCQASEFGLKKGTAYHWDFAIVGIQVFITGLLGIPPVNGLIPQAPLHTDSLCEKGFKKDDESGIEEEVVLKVHEQRVSNLSQALLIGGVLPFIKVVGLLPCAVLDGLFVYMGKRAHAQCPTLNTTLTACCMLSLSLFVCAADRRCVVRRQHFLRALFTIHHGETLARRKKAAIHGW